MRILLASKSQNRQDILKLSQIPFEVLDINADEDQIKDKNFKSHEDRVIAIAGFKMDQAKLKVQNQDSIVIVGDGFNVCNDQILEKPQDLQQAREMLEMLSDNTTDFYSGLVMFNSKNQQTFRHVSKTTVWFRKLTNSEINDYIQTVAVTKYAAAYSPLNTKAITFIKKIEGSLSGFSHSLPMDVIIEQLRIWNAL